MKTAAVTVRKRVRTSEIPAAWKVELPDDPDAPVEVAITPLVEHQVRSPRRFFGAGQGLFSSAAEIDADIRGNRDAWEE